MRNLLSLFVLVLLLDGCFTSRPPDSVDFGNIETIRALEGVYENLGVSEQGVSPVYLSALIWPGGPPATSHLIHGAIATIEVRVLNHNTLVVRASSKDGVEKEDTFVEGENFEIHAGRIRLKQSAGFIGFFESGGHALGPHYDREELGLDSKGHGMLRKQSVFAGLVMMYIPLAVGETREVRFVRIDKVPNPSAKPSSVPRPIDDFVNCVAGGERRWTYRSKCD